MNKETKVIIVYSHESIRTSFTRDLLTAVVFFVLYAVSAYYGFFPLVVLSLAVVGVFGWSLIETGKDSKKMDPESAIEHIKKEYL